MSTGLPKLVKRFVFTPGSKMEREIKKRWGATDLRILSDDPEVYAALGVFIQRYQGSVHPRVLGKRPFRCVLHGDLHAGNFMFMPDGTMKAFDWQMWGWGHPAQELAQLLASSVKPDRGVDERVLRAYHSELSSVLQGS